MFFHIQPTFYHYPDLFHPPPHTHTHTALGRTWMSGMEDLSELTDTAHK